MAVKNALLPVHIISAAPMTASLTGATTNIQWLDNVGIQYIYSGSPSGTLTVNCSLDQVHWDQVPGTTAISASSSGHSYVNISNLAAPYVQIVFAFTSGTGTLDAYICAKDI